LPKIQPRTNYITKILEFQGVFEAIHLLSTKDQKADFLTKPLAEVEFKKQKMRIMGEERGEVYTNLEGHVRKIHKATRTDKVAGFRKQESVGSIPKTRENSTSKSIDAKKNKANQKK